MMSMHLLLRSFYLFYYDEAFVIVFECNPVLMSGELDLLINNLIHRMTFYLVNGFE
jgi:hypothetical protein